ncbi:sugar ABC transporter ATP-binding protein [Microvirga brassicacearum]|uniref:Sugar ABC transporter ATP-binding protein n=1 Tax=Microvirga brassicacearum TaxID=2580413 RepID=A0A5N3PCI9_9HYPH|nr:sugar ABC transporter ATP-binding protein [Microvirga brassicacearum]KAB0267420.1 sugar ABC transporter ATP-binding protein [Microvirga brassicacearum]
MASVLRADNLSKSFGPIEVLSGVSLDLKTGEVHAVIGENGAGKSTLMRILSGHLQPTSGVMHLNDKPTAFASPVEAEREGIVLVHQEILLAPDLTVAQNLFLGRELRRFGFVDDEAMRERTRTVLAELGTAIDPDVEIRHLSIADRQLVQIARALLVPHKIVAFDEPTAVLTPVEAESLFDIVRRLSQQGVAVLYISHRLNEVKAIADRVTVLRDGRLVATREIESLEPIEMARLMVGRDMSKLYPEKPDTASADTIMTVRHMTVPDYVDNVSFTLRRGEILGFGGLIGAGRTELFEGLVGLRRAKGTITLDDRDVYFRDARHAMASGIVYLSEDRKGKGLLLQQDLRTNLTLATLERFTRGPFINVAAEDAALDAAIGDFDIRTRRRDLLAGQLSGGNQQKLLLAKMMLAKPRIVIIDEPTRGVDIGTKEQIYRFIASLAEQGCSVIVISSEMQELIGLCHRVLVMRNGRIAGELAQADLSEDAIVFLATGVHEERAAEIAAGHA